MLATYLLTGSLSLLAALVGQSDTAAPSDGKAVLTKMQDAARAAKTIKYEAEYLPEGWLTAFVPTLRGTAVVGKQSEHKVERFFADVVLKSGNSDEEIKLSAGCDGDQYFLVDARTSKAHQDMDPAVLGRQGRNIRRVVLGDLGAADPFADELKAESIELKETTTLDGHECHVVECVQSKDRKTTWYISGKDWMPRKMVRTIVNDKGETGTITFTLSKLTVDPRLDADPFKLQLPAGYTKTDEFAE